MSVRRRSRPSRRTFGPAALAAAAFLAAGARAAAQLGPMPAPPENPITAEKAVLGKILFWDEQLSSDNTIACGTCHQPAQGGADPRFVRTPGRDGKFMSPDDTWGSPGVRLAGANGEYLPAATAGFDRQVTGRISQEFMAAGYHTDLFWDGRAKSRFVDPFTGLQLIAAGGALESQVIGPPVSDVEMAHQGRDWHEIEKKLAKVRPLALAADFPPDVVAALVADPTYPDLFDAAFGDPGISAARIAFAIATYERTLAPRETPWDRYIVGITDALTDGQERGWNLFIGKARCNLCHVPPLFSDDKFHNIGVRPVAEDRGLQNVTGKHSDRGLFKTPTLRSTSRRRRWMHNGKFGDLNHVIDFYIRGGDFSDNLDPLMIPVTLTQQEKFDLYDFLTNGLVVADADDETGVYARPTLREELPANPGLFGRESAGSGGFVPRMIADVPPNLGNTWFKLGVAGGLGGAPALLALGPEQAPPDTDLNGIPLNVHCVPEPYLIPFTLAGSGDGQGYATMVLPLANEPALAGQDWYAQWFVQDAAAPGGWSATLGAKIVLY